MIRSLVVTLALVTLTSTVHATPLLAPDSLPAVSRRALTERVRTARTQRPALFARVSDLRGLRPAVYRASRARRPSVTQELMALGPDALMPMLEMLALREYPRTLTAEEHTALQIGLLEAVGALRDRRAEPVLRAAFESMASEEAFRAAARGLGALCGDGEIALLSTHARTAGPRRTAALEGLGRCRRMESVQSLVTELDRATDEATVLAAAQALGTAGSSWAQTAAQTAVPAPALAAQALVRAFVRHTGAVRDEIGTALLAAGYTGTPDLLLEAARSADAPTRDALTSLARIARRGL